MHTAHNTGHPENSGGVCIRSEYTVAGLSDRAIFFELRVAPRNQNRQVFKTLKDEDEGNHSRCPRLDIVVGKDLNGLTLS